MPLSVKLPGAAVVGRPSLSAVSGRKCRMQIKWHKAPHSATQSGTSRFGFSQSCHPVKPSRAAIVAGRCCSQRADGKDTCDKSGSSRGNGEATARIPRKNLPAGLVVPHKSRGANVVGLRLDSEKNVHRGAGEWKQRWQCDERDRTMAEIHAMSACCTCPVQSRRAGTILH
jgi:hypothetical protein